MLRLTLGSAVAPHEKADSAGANAIYLALHNGDVSGGLQPPS